MKLLKQTKTLTQRKPTTQKLKFWQKITFIQEHDIKKLAKLLSRHILLLDFFSFG